MDNGSAQPPHGIPPARGPAVSPSNVAAPGQQPPRSFIVGPTPMPTGHPASRGIPGYAAPALGHGAPGHAAPERLADGPSGASSAFASGIIGGLNGGASGTPISRLDHGRADLFRQQQQAEAALARHEGHAYGHGDMDPGAGAGAGPAAGRPSLGASHRSLHSLLLPLLPPPILTAGAGAGAGAGVYGTGRGPVPAAAVAAAVDEEEEEEEEEEEDDLARSRRGLHSSALGPWPAPAPARGTDRLGAGAAGAGAGGVGALPPSSSGSVSTGSAGIGAGAGSGSGSGAGAGAGVGGRNRSGSGSGGPGEYTPLVSPAGPAGAGARAAASSSLHSSSPASGQQQQQQQRSSLDGSDQLGSPMPLPSPLPTSDAGAAVPDAARAALRSLRLGPDEFTVPRAMLDRKSFTSQEGLLGLSADVIAYICGYLEVPDLARLAATSHRLRHTVYLSVFWSSLDLTAFATRVTDRVALRLLRQPRFCRLTTLNLSGCTALTDRFLARLPLMCPLLTQLTLTHCYNFTTDTVYETATTLPRLLRLGLSGSPADGAAVRPLLEHARARGIALDLGLGWLRYCAETGSPVDMASSAPRPVCRHDPNLAGGGGGMRAVREGTQRPNNACWGVVSGRLIYSVVSGRDALAGLRQRPLVPAIRPRPGHRRGAKHVHGHGDDADTDAYADTGGSGQRGDTVLTIGAADDAGPGYGLSAALAGGRLGRGLANSGAWGGDGDVDGDGDGDGGDDGAGDGTRDGSAAPPEDAIAAAEAGLYIREVRPDTEAVAAADVAPALLDQVIYLQAQQRYVAPLNSSASRSFDRLLSRYSATPGAFLHDVPTRGGPFPVRVSYYCTAHSGADMWDADLRHCFNCNRMYEPHNMYSDALCHWCHDVFVTSMPDAWISLPFCRLDEFNLSLLIAKLCYYYDIRHLPRTLRPYGVYPLTVDRAAIEAWAPSAGAAPHALDIFGQAQAREAAATAAAAAARAALNGEEDDEDDGAGAGRGGPGERASLLAAGTGAAPGRHAPGAPALLTSSGTPLPRGGAKVRARAGPGDPAVSVHDLGVLSPHLGLSAAAFGAAASGVTSGALPPLPRAGGAGAPPLPESIEMGSMSRSSARADADADAAAAAAVAAAAAAGGDATAALRRAAQARHESRLAAAPATLAAAPGAPAAAPGGDGVNHRYGQPLIAGRVFEPQRGTVVDPAAPAVAPGESGPGAPAAGGRRPSSHGLQLPGQFVPTVYVPRTEAERSGRPILLERDGLGAAHARAAGAGAGVELGAGAGAGEDEDDEDAEAGDTVPLSALLQGNTDAISAQVEAIRDALRAAKNDGRERALLCVDKHHLVRVLADDQCIMPVLSEEAMHRADRACPHVLAVLLPFFVSMTLTLYFMGAYERDGDRPPLNGRSNPSFYIAEPSSSSDGLVIFLVAAVVVIVAAGVLFFVFFNRCRDACARVFKALVAMELLLVFGVGLYFMLVLFAQDVQLPLDAITFSLFIFNGAVLAMLTAYLDRVPSGARQAGLLLLYVTLPVLLGCVLPAVVLGIFLGCMACVDLIAMCLPGGGEIAPMLMPTTFQLMYERPRILYCVGQDTRIRAGDFIWFAFIVAVAQSQRVFSTILAFIAALSCIAMCGFALPYKGVELRPLVLAAVSLVVILILQPAALAPFKEVVTAATTGTVSFTI